MTEGMWLNITDLQRLLAFATASGSVSDRKLRLFAVACCRRLWPLLADERSREAIEVAERFANGEATEAMLNAAHLTAQAAYEDVYNHSTEEHDYRPAEAVEGATHPDIRRAVAAAARYAAGAVGEGRGGEEAAQVASLRDLFGPLLFRPVTLAPEVVAWDRGALVRLAQAIHDERRFQDLPVLADALEEAGCTEPEILRHCRGPADHTPGCWVLDLLLGKEAACPPTPPVPGQEGDTPAVPEMIRFTPSHVDGITDVREVVVRPHCLEVNTAGRWATFLFREIGRPQQSRLRSLLGRLVGKRPPPVMVADRDWFHPPPGRFFLWYTTPPLRTCMPEDEPADYASSYFYRIQAVLASGGYATFDLG
jgi:hypothetical protein